MTLFLHERVEDRHEPTAGEHVQLPGDAKHRVRSLHDHRLRHGAGRLPLVAVTLSTGMRSRLAACQATVSRMPRPRSNAGAYPSTTRAWSMDARERDSLHRAGSNRGTALSALGSYRATP